MDAGRRCKPRSSALGSHIHDAQGSASSAERLLDLIDLLAEAPLAVGEAARELGVNKSTASRTLALLAARRYAIRSPESGIYRLGPRVGELCEAYVDVRRIARDAPALLEGIAKTTGETVLLTSFDGDRAFYVDKIESRHPLRTSSRIGDRAPLHGGAAGKSILAFLQPEEVREIVGDEPLPRFGPRTIVTLEDLWAELAVVRRRGYAISIEEINEGIVGVGVPLLAPTGRPIGAISVTAPRGRFAQDEVRRTARGLMSAVREWNLGIGPWADPD